MIPTREQKALGHHSDNGVGHRTDANCAADDLWIRSQTGLPQVVSDHDHVRCADYLVFFDERTPEQWQHAEDREDGGRHFGPPDRRRSAVFGNDVVGVRAPHTEGLVRRELVSPLQQVVEGPTQWVCLDQIPILECHDLVGVRHRKRPRDRVDEVRGQ